MINLIWGQMLNYNNYFLLHMIELKLEKKIIPKLRIMIPNSQLMVKKKVLEKKLKALNKLKFLKF